MKNNVTLYFEYFIVLLISTFFIYLLRFSKYETNRTLTQLKSENISKRYCKCVKLSIIN